MAACGRGFGKTHLGAADVHDDGRNRRPCLVGGAVVSMALVGSAAHQAAECPVSGAGKCAVSERLIALPNGGEIQVRSADNPDSLHSEGV